MLEIYKLTQIFKFFVDVEEERVRFVINDSERLVNRDFQPDNFDFFLTKLSD